MTVLLDMPYSFQCSKPLLVPNFGDPQMPAHAFVIPRVPVELVDIVLVSSEKSLGVCWLISDSRFRGRVYATPPVIQKMAIEYRQIAEYLEYSRFSLLAEKSEVATSKYHEVVDFPRSFPSDRIESIHFFQEIVRISCNLKKWMDYCIGALASEYSIGACNYLISCGAEKVLIGKFVDLLFRK
jgi:hypothetical protein